MIRRFGTRTIGLQISLSKVFESAMFDKRNIQEIGGVEVNPNLAESTRGCWLGAISNNLEEAQLHRVRPR